MSKPVMITADSTCDLSPEMLERLNVKTLPLTIMLGDESFPDSVEFSPERMYERYRADGTLPKTGAPGPQQFIDFFEPKVNEGYEIVHLSLSSGLSATCNNARLAASEFEGVYVIDSLMLSSGIALLVMEACSCRDKGMSAADIAAYIEGIVPKVDTSFVLDTLEFMWKGGRCSGVAALGANLLKLKPALEMKDGQLGVYKKYRGSIGSVYKQYIKERVAGKKLLNKRIFITNSGEVEESTLQELEALVRECAGAEEVYFSVAGCTISSHCGPKTLGVLFINE